MVRGGAGAQYPGITVGMQGSDDPITQSPENRPCRKQRSPPTPASSKSPSTNSPRTPASPVAAPPVKSPCACASTSRSPARLLLLAGAVPPPRDQRRIPSYRLAPRSLLPTGAAPPPTVRRRAPSQQLHASIPSCVNPTSQSARALRLRCPQHPRVGDPELRDQPSPPSNAQVQQPHTPPSGARCCPVQLAATGSPAKDIPMAWWWSSTSLQVQSRETGHGDLAGPTGQRGGVHQEALGSDRRSEAPQEGFRLQH